MSTRDERRVGRGRTESGTVRTAWVGRYGSGNPRGHPRAPAGIRKARARRALYDSRMYARNASISRFVSAPGWPAPTSRPSILVTGMTSAPVPVRKHSSAVYRS